MTETVTYAIKHILDSDPCDLCYRSRYMRSTRKKNKQIVDKSKANYGQIGDKPQADRRQIDGQIDGKSRANRGIFF